MSEKAISFSRTTTHFKKQIIQQHERSTPDVSLSPSRTICTTPSPTNEQHVLSPNGSSNQTTKIHNSPTNSDVSNEDSTKEMSEEGTSSARSKRKKSWKRKNCRGQFRHEDMEFIKLGDENTSRALCKQKEYAINRIYKHLKIAPIVSARNDESINSKKNETVCTNTNVPTKIEVQMDVDDPKVDDPPLNCAQNADGANTTQCDPVVIVPNLASPEVNNNLVDDNRQSVSVIKRASPTVNAKLETNEQSECAESVPNAPSIPNIPNVTNNNNNNNTTDKVPSFVVVINDTSTLDVKNYDTVIKVTQKAPQTAGFVQGADVDLVAPNCAANVSFVPVQNLHTKCYVRSDKGAQKRRTHAENLAKAEARVPKLVDQHFGMDTLLHRPQIEAEQRYRATHPPPAQAEPFGRPSFNMPEANNFSWYQQPHADQKHSGVIANQMVANQPEAVSRRVDQHRISRNQINMRRSKKSLETKPSDVNQQQVLHQHHYSNNVSASQCGRDQELNSYRFPINFNNNNGLQRAQGIVQIEVDGGRHRQNNSNVGFNHNQHLVPYQSVPRAHVQILQPPPPPYQFQPNQIQKFSYQTLLNSNNQIGTVPNGGNCARPQAPTSNNHISLSLQQILPLLKNAPSATQTHPSRLTAKDQPSGSTQIVPNRSGNGTAALNYQNSRFPFIENSDIGDYHDGFSKCIRQVLSNTASAETYQILLNKYEKLEQDSELIRNYALENSKRKNVEAKKFDELYVFLERSFSGNVAKQLIDKIERARIRTNNNHTNSGQEQHESRTMSGLHQPDNFIDLTCDSDSEKDDVSVLKNYPSTNNTFAIPNVPNTTTHTTRYPIVSKLLNDNKHAQQQTIDIQSNEINSSVTVLDEMSLSVFHNLDVLGPRQYSDEITYLEKDRAVPELLKEFYRYVSKVQIRNRREPVSFRTFHDLYANNRLAQFESDFEKYCRKRNFHINFR